MLELRGAMHVHSTYSSDADVELSTIVTSFRQRGYDFAAIAEHVEDLTPADVPRLVDECRARSTDSFRLIPGLEIKSSEGLHVVGVGLTEYVAPGPVASVVRGIRRQGGLAILAHARRGADRRLADVVPDGLELWNTKYDTRYAPGLHRLLMLRRLQARNGALRGYCSVDYHWPRQYVGAAVLVRAARREEAAVLEALRGGRFVGQVGGELLPADGAVPAEQFVRLALWACYARPLLSAIGIAKRAARALPVSLPKRRLRRVLLKLT